MKKPKINPTYPAWFNRGWPPRAPIAPIEPQQSIIEYRRKDNGRNITLYDCEVHELNGIFKYEKPDPFYDEDAKLFECDKVTKPNKHYEKQHQSYLKALAKYQQDIEAHKLQMAEYLILCAKYDQDQVNRNLSEKRQLLARLKKELGET